MQKPGFGATYGNFNHVLWRWWKEALPTDAQSSTKAKVYLTHRIKRQKQQIIKDLRKSDNKFLRIFWDDGEV